MATIRQLSPAHCVLLATHCAADSRIPALRSLSLARPDAFSPETLLRILLTFLPESAEPSTYNLYAQEVASRLYTQQIPQADVDTSLVGHLSSSQAQKRVNKLDLLPLAHTSCTDLKLDLLTLFLIHRAYRIDAETGLLGLVPPLVDPFLDHSQHLRAWFISTILPLLRLDFEYYPNGSSATPLEKFAGVQGPSGVDFLIRKAEEASVDSDTEDTRIARDIKGIIGPWVYGFDQRKSRKVLNIARRRSSVGSSVAEQIHQGENAAPGAARDHHDWEHVYAWMVRKAPQRFDLISNAVEYWDGPGDVDLGGYEDPNHQDGLDEETQSHLERRYAQAAFASVYCAESDSKHTIEAAHSVLVRLSQIMDFVPPPDLASSVEMLPKIEGRTSVLHGTTTAILQPDTLMNATHPLTVPTAETYALLQIFVYSAYILADLGHPIAINNLARFRFHADEDDQHQLVNKILKSLVNRPKSDEEMWRAARNKLLWLWNWGMDPSEEHAANGPGIFGKIARFSLEEVILTSLLADDQLQLAREIYLPDDRGRDHLQDQDIEECVLSQVMQYYDNASNGNVTRGSMKKALDIMTAFQPYFSDSPAFLATEALLAATHSLSFYSLTLQHGVPFRPVNIRISEDPISLISKVLEQNPRSYSKLDDLVTIGQNLVAGRTLERDGPLIEESEFDTEERKRAASHRVMGMAIEAALAEDDFETAYSFVVNRLNPSFDPTASKDPSNTTHQVDDISWRAAYLAGRHRSPNSSLASSQATVAGSPALRRLEQRMELLSQALLLAPPSAVPEVLTAWRRCEEEMSALLAQETEEEERFNDHADRRAPGAFPTQATYIQPRREVGRNATEEAPMGLFDVARGAASAFSKSAFPLRAATNHGGGQESGRSSLDASRNLSVADSDPGSGEESGRVRKRDMVTNAVTGGLASGLGWVLGATPVSGNQQGNK
ncbi:secretory pathway sec39 [Diplodia corticola]|uniref:Secretory pathway sec39 n=1 Tax=Diplodia corticola TaxID=236234 RepID=A0A1J9RNG3_9PEZI|nr:secretory pathway sec39 [Diplodia corticola]OJD29133.1 secretory pathway sec39 [Diplodia corticola]